MATKTDSTSTDLEKVHGGWRPPGNWALKVTMAVTGLIWVAFVLIHLYGNLKVFIGPESFNTYAHWLRHAFYPLFPEGFILWAMRIILVVALLLHIWAATIVWLRGRRAGGKSARINLRDRARGGRGTVKSVSAQLMPYTGLAILAFLIMHVLDLTLGASPVAPVEFAGHTESASYAYANLVASFQRPWMAAIYLLMMVLLSVHVFHGVQTAGQDLGAMGYRLRQVLVWVGGLCALVILAGNGFIPVAVQMGWLS